MKRLLLTISLIPILLTGCSSLAQVAKQLKDDPAFVTVHVRTLYGSGFLVRDGRPANGNTVTPEGGVQSLFQPPAPVIVTNIQQRVTNIVDLLNDPQAFSVGHGIDVGTLQQLPQQLQPRAARLLVR